jgi:tRNA (guanine9-N1)-methyltransferase
MHHAGAPSCTMLKQRDRFTGLSVEALAGVPTAKLKPSFFAVQAAEVGQHWDSISKSALKKAMLEVQWVKLREERDRRKAAAVEASGGGGGGGGIGAAVAPGASKSLKRSRPQKAIAEGPKGHPIIAVDCGFDELMTPTENYSLTKQLVHSYAAVKRVECSPASARLFFTGLSAARVDALSRIVGVSAWRLYATQNPLELAFPAACRSDSSGNGKGGGGGGAASTLHCGVGFALPTAFCEALPPQRLVYLSSEAAEVLWEPAPGTCYIVGGLVDRNRHKGVSFAKAAGLGLPTARLPLVEVLNEVFPGGFAAASRHLRVLTTNKAVQVLAEVCSGGGGGAGQDGETKERKLMQLWAAVVKRVLLQEEKPEQPEQPEAKEEAEGE